MSNYIPKGGGGSPTSTILLVIGAAILGFVNGQIRRTERQESPSPVINQDDGYVTYMINPPTYNKN